MHSCDNDGRAVCNYYRIVMAHSVEFSCCEGAAKLSKQHWSVWPRVLLGIYRRGFKGFGGSLKGQMYLRTVQYITPDSERTHQEEWLGQSVGVQNMLCLFFFFSLF